MSMYDPEDWKDSENSLKTRETFTIIMAILIFLAFCGALLFL